MRRYTYLYHVKASIWLAAGIALPWEADVAIAEPADTEHGYALLKLAVHQLAARELLDNGLEPRGKLVLNEWRLVQRR